MTAVHFPAEADHILVCDLETTTLAEPHEPGSYVLEVGAILCAATPDLPVLAQANLVVQPPGGQEEVHRLWAAMDPYVQTMHTTSGLWADATTSQDAWPVWEADTQLTRWLQQHTDGSGLVALAGAGVGHFDDRWLRWHFPQLRAHLTYWNIDASSFRRALELAGRHDLVDLAKDVDAKPHRALPDARLHREELRRYLRLLQALPVGEVDPRDVDLTADRAGASVP